MLNLHPIIELLFSSAKKNFRVTFPNGGTDIKNDQIVSESVKMSEGVCSENVFRFGAMERSSIEFDAVGISDITGQTISCYLELDCSSLSAAELNAVDDPQYDGELVRSASSDLGYPFYRIPYGGYLVQSADRAQGSHDRRHVSAMSRAPWAWSPVERARLDTWYGATTNTTRKESPKDLIYANLGFWNNDLLTDAGYTETFLAGFTTLQGEATTFSKSYESTSGGTTWKTTITGKMWAGWPSVGSSKPAGLYGARTEGYDDPTAAWDYFLALYADSGAPLPAVPQPGTPVDQRSPRCYLQNYVGFDFMSEFGPGHYGAGSNFNPNYWMPSEGTPVAYFYGRGTINPQAFFSFVWDVQIKFYKNGTQQKSATFFSSNVDVNLYYWDDSDPFPYNVATEASAAIESLDTTGTSYPCYSDSYDMQEFLQSWLELTGSCIGSDRYGLPRIWSFGDGRTGITRSKYEPNGFIWDPSEPMPVSTILWSYDDGEEVHDMQLTVTDPGADWVPSTGSIMDIRNNYVLLHLQTTASNIEGVIGDFLLPVLAKTVSLGADDWDAMLFPSFTLRAVCIPWLEAGDLITVWADDNTKVQSWALQQSISGINVLRQSVTASAGMTAEVDDGD